MVKCQCQGCLRRGLTRAIADSGHEASRVACLLLHTPVEEAVGVIGFGEDFVCVILTSSSVDTLVIVLGCRPGKHYLKTFFLLLPSPPFLLGVLRYQQQSDIYSCAEKKDCFGRFMMELSKPERLQLLLRKCTPEGGAGSRSTHLLDNPFWSSVVSDRIRKV